MKITDRVSHRILDQQSPLSVPDSIRLKKSPLSLPSALWVDFFVLGLV